MRQECAAFIKANEADLDAFSELTGRDAGSMGHDLWLTRNGHGAGYWDRYMEAAPDDRDRAEKLGQTLSEAARKLGEQNLMPHSGELVEM